MGYGSLLNTKLKKKSPLKCILLSGSRENYLQNKMSENNRIRRLDLLEKSRRHPCHKFMNTVSLVLPFLGVIQNTENRGGKLEKAEGHL